MSKLFDDAKKIYDDIADKNVKAVMVYDGNITSVDVESYKWGNNEDLKDGLVVCGIITIGVIVADIVNRYRKNR